MKPTYVHFIRACYLMIVIGLSSLGLSAQNLSLTLNADSVHACATETILLEVQVTGGSGNYQYTWSTGETADSIQYLVQAGPQWVWVSVQDNGGPAQSDSVFVLGYPECVWPGDANGDGMANNEDILFIGRAYGQQGGTRPNAHLNWIGQAAPAWQHTFASGVNYVHSDADGNGFVDQADVVGIDYNYVVPQLSPGLSPVSANGAPFYLTFNPTNPGPGDTLRIGVHLGTANQPVDSIYGLAFSVTYDAAIIDSGSIQVDYTQSWIGTPGTDLITVDKDFFNNSQIDIGISRIDQNQAAGFGRMAEIIVAIEDIVGKKEGVELVNFSLEHVSLLGKNGEALETQPDSAQLGIVLSNRPQFDESLAFTLFPNPASTSLNVELGSFSNIREGEINIRDIQGRLLRQTSLTGKNQYRWDIRNLPAGMYLVEILAENKRFTQKVIIRPE